MFDVERELPDAVGTELAGELLAQTRQADAHQLLLGRLVPEQRRSLVLLAQQFLLSPLLPEDDPFLQFVHDYEPVY